MPHPPRVDHLAEVLGGDLERLPIREEQAHAGEDGLVVADRGLSRAVLVAEPARKRGGRGWRGGWLAPPPVGAGRAPSRQRRALPCGWWLCSPPGPGPGGGGPPRGAWGGGAPPRVSVTAGERRIVSVLVADVAGSTSIAEKLGPERSKFLFDEVVALMRGGGGALRRHRRAADRRRGAGAVRCADGARGRLRARRSRSARDPRGTRPLRGRGRARLRDRDRARVAVNTGPVVVPGRDAPPHELYNALGDTVNVAARLQSFGDLVVGQATAHQVDESFELEELGELELKGKERARHRVPRRGRPRATPARLEAPLVGRKEELAALRRGPRRAPRGKGGDRLDHRRARNREVTPRRRGRRRGLAGASASSPVTPSPTPRRSPTGRCASSSAAGSVSASPIPRPASGSSYGRSLPARSPTRQTRPIPSSPASSASLEPEEEPRIDFAPDAVQHETFHWLYQLVCTLARERPLCLVLEDLHWSDEATLSLLDELLPRPSRPRSASCSSIAVTPITPPGSSSTAPAGASGRSSWSSSWSRCPCRHTRARRSRRWGRAAGAAGAAPRRADGRQPLLRRRGDPRSAGARRAGAENGHLVLVSQASIPAALQEALQARLDRLDAEARELLTTAAVIGRSFGLPVLERLLPRRTAAADPLRAPMAPARGRGARRKPPEYRFRHGLVQEAAYGLAPRSPPA